MKKLLVSSTLFFAALLGAGSAMAQAQNQNCGNNCNPNCSTEQCASKNCADCNKACDKTSCNSCATPCAVNPRAAKGGPCNMFDGLNLTDKQQADLKALRQDGNRNMSRKDRLDKIKTILTPEQYQQFLENAFVNGSNQDGRHGRMIDRQRNLKGHRNQMVQKAQKLEKKDSKDKK